MHAKAEQHFFIAASCQTTFYPSPRQLVPQRSGAVVASCIQRSRRVSTHQIAASDTLVLCAMSHEGANVVTRSFRRAHSNGTCERCCVPLQVLAGSNNMPLPHNFGIRTSCGEHTYRDVHREVRQPSGANAVHADKNNPKQ
eukprot:5081716-Pleurochrysis_carterae.AAC.2